ncbi:MAG: transporter [Candidatus Manganitrophaceae bacterium]|nr:MAG: transporter [Candidatus Manganitrophaceae bacterium]
MRRILVWNVMLLITLTALLGAKAALASCGSANCFLVTGTQEGIASPGQLVLDLSYRWIPMDQVHRGSQSAEEALVPRIDFENGEIVQNGHREIRTNNELAQLDVSYGVTPRFALTLAVPFMNNRTHEHAHVPGTFTREDGTAGFGDLRLVGKYALWISTKHLLVGGLGIKAPTGEYKLLDHDGEINEPTLQPGTGSWDPLASLYYAYQIIPHELDAFVSTSYQYTTENSLDYQIGSTLIVNAGVSYRINEKVLTSLQVNGRQAPHDEFHGRTVSSTGGRWVYITPGITVQASPNTALYTHLQLPVYQYVNEVNLVPRYGLIFGISHVF